jgi:hypothetical protein
MKNVTETAVSCDHGLAETDRVRRTLSRREFLERASLSSAALTLAPALAQGTADYSLTSARPRYAAFHALAPGAVSPEGWLGTYLRKQAAQLGQHLPETSWPFTGAYWAGEEKPPEGSGDIGWWPWEQKAYWIDGALRCALVLHDEKLLKGALAPVDYTLNHVADDGFIGPTFARDAELHHPQYGNFRWFHTVFFRALAAHAEATADPRVPAAMRRHYLADQHRARYGGTSRDITNVEGMAWAYERTGDPQLLAMAEHAWSEFLRSAGPGDRDAGDLHPDRVYADTPIHAHGVTYIEQAKLPAILYLYTGKPEYLRFALAAQQRIFDHHMLIDGMPSTQEMYAGTSAVHAHETCDITDHTWSWGYLLMATGEGVWADRIERACFNAGMGAIRKDWKAVQYFSSPNQVIATHDSNHVPLVPDDTPWMSYSPNPGHETACCSGNVHRLFPNYVIRMWMSESDGEGLAAVLYGASIVRARVGASHELIEIEQQTQYPFDEEIHLTIRSDRAVAFPLSLRIPGWCTQPRLALNGRPMDMPPIQRGFVRVARTFHPGDRLTLTLPMQLLHSYWPDQGVGVEHGPLVYALAIKETWTPVVTPKYSTTRFPEWDATAAAPWNYGIVFSEALGVSQLKVERRAPTGDPWVNPPVSLPVSLKKIPGWELRSHSQHPERKLTPLLPEIDDELEIALERIETEQVALVPYGSTQLRISIFPEIAI